MLFFARLQHARFFPSVCMYATACAQHVCFSLPGYSMYAAACLQHTTAVTKANSPQPPLRAVHACAHAARLVRVWVFGTLQVRDVEAAVYDLLTPVFTSFFAGAKHEGYATLACTCTHA